MYLLEFAGEDDAYAAAEAGIAASGVEIVAEGVATATAIVPERMEGLALTRWTSELVGGTDASVDSAVTLLESSTFDRDGSVAVRARDVRGTADVDTQFAERALGDVLSARGFPVDLVAPDVELRACFAGDRCFLGWLVVEGTRSFGDRAPTEKPFFQPGSMDPIEARALVNLAGARPGVHVMDPMCGTGGLLVEAGLIGAAVLGFDTQTKMARGAIQNLTHYLEAATDFDVCRGDASRLPLRDGAVDAVVVDTPYGRQSKIASENVETLIEAALREARRVGDRAVVVSDRPASGVATDAGWTVEAVFERPVHRSLVRHVHVLTARGG